MKTNLESETMGSINIIEGIFTTIGISAGAIANNFYYDCIKNILGKTLRPGELRVSIRNFFKNNRIPLSFDQEMQLESALVAKLKLKQETCAFYAEDSSTIMVTNCIVEGFDKVAISKNNSFINLEGTEIKRY